MNEIFGSLGMAHLKPIATALLLPPVPFFVLALIGSALMPRRHRLGACMLLVALAMIWASGCLGAANALSPLLLRPLPPLTERQIVELRRHANEPVAIIVLGSGVEPWAPEYRTSSLKDRSLERLRYGLWLGRRTGWPVGFSGGIGWGQPSGGIQVAEATVAQRIATEEFGRPLRWVEPNSRDTHENAVDMLALLRAGGIKRIVLVSHAWHMQRAVRNFERAAGDTVMRIDAAPIGLATETEMPWMRWMPSGDGLNLNRAVVREWLGLLSGA